MKKDKISHLPLRNMYNNAKVVPFGAPNAPPSVLFLIA